MKWIKKIKDVFRSTSPQKNLRKALQISREKKEKAAFVFDVDSTLFCMKHRTQAIINQAMKEESLLKKFVEDSKQNSDPNSKKRLKITVTERDWSIVEILSRYGIKDKKLLKRMESYWRRWFFSERYLHLDRPYEGAVDFLKQLSGSAVYYLTARNHNRVRLGTLKSFKEWGFPLEKDSYLIMKKSPKEKDIEYKIRELACLSKEFETVCFFENEPVILNRVNKALPPIQLFWMNSAHSKREKAPRKALTLSMTYSF